MKDCTCGQPVRLRASRISVNRRRGVVHWIEHMDGTKVCVPGEWSCAAIKPYPKRDADHEYAKLTARWEVD